MPSQTDIDFILTGIRPFFFRKLPYIPRNLNGLAGMNEALVMPSVVEIS